MPSFWKNMKFYEIILMIENYIYLFMIMGVLFAVIFAQFQILSYILKYLISFTSLLSGILSIHFLLKNQEKVTNWITEYLKDDNHEDSLVKPTIKISCVYYHPCLDIYCIPEIDNSVEKFYQTVLDHYIEPWNSKISENKELRLEICHSLKLTTSILIYRLNQAVHQKNFKENIYKILISHLDLYQINKNEILLSTADDENLQNTIIQKSLNQLHVGILSRQNELDYLTRLTQHLLPLIFSSNTLKSMILTTLLKDLLSYRVLLPIMDIIADPDFINHIMIILLEGKVTYYPDVSQRPKVILLKHMCAQIPITKPVIQVRLKEIVHNQDLLFIFMNFMKSEGVLNLIQFYMSLEDFMKLILNPDLKVQQIDILYRQCQQIYQNFFDASSPDKIDFDETTINQMKEITEDKPENVLKLRNTSPLYTAREHVVSLLDNIFIPLFCQSGSFMNWILGEKGFAADKLNQKSGKKSTEVMVAVSKLGNRIKGVFKPSSQIDNTDSTEFIHGRYSFKPEIKQFTKTNDRIPDFSNEDEISSISSGDLFNELTPKDNINSFYHSFSTPAIHQEDQLDDDGQALKLILSRAVVENERDISKLYVTLSKIESRIDFNGRQNFYFLISVRRKENGISLAEQGTLTNELNINQSTSISEAPPPPTSSVMFDMEDDDGISMKSESSTYSNRQPYNLLAATGSPSPREWVVERRYMEFYLLESKLTEFHGVFEDIQLPAKRVFNAKDWAFVNSKRSSFETYLRKLCTKPELKTSELLYTFLTSSEDFYEFCAGISASGGGGPGNFLLPDIGIGKMLKAPLRLLPEKGQHLEPFLQSFIASTGVYDDNNLIKRSRQQPIPPVEINKSDTPPYDYNTNKDTTPSISSSSANVKNCRTIEQFHPYNSWIDNSLFRRDFSHFNSINTTTDPNNNKEMPLTAATCISEPKNKFHMEKLKKKRKQYAITGLYDYLIYFCFNIYRVPEWMIKLLLAFRLGLKPIFELYVARIISRKTRLLTHPIFINDTLKLINKSIFPGEVKSAAAQSPESIEICKKERADKARQLAKDNSSALLKWILPQKNIEEGTDLIFQCFQHPILNKHLAYMLLDSLISAMFPELAKPTISLSSK